MVKTLIEDLKKGEYLSHLYETRYSGREFLYRVINFDAENNPNNIVINLYEKNGSLIASEIEFPLERLLSNVRASKGLIEMPY